MGLTELMFPKDMIQRGIVPQYLTFQRKTPDLKKQGMTQMAPKLCKLLCSIPYSANLPNTYVEVKEDAYGRRKSIIWKAKAFSDMLKDCKDPREPIMNGQEVRIETEDADLKVSDCILSTVVNGFSKKIGFLVMVKVFKELIFKGYESGQVTYASVINAYFHLEQYSKAEEVFLEMEQKGFDKCVYAYSTMIVMYGRMGRVTSAMKLVAKMKQRGCKPNVWIYNSLIDMHRRDNNLKQLEKLWKEMKRRRVAP
ncbi:hypothetical protein JHK87_004589 [Glycine soja]|nr:hypothetical protein JHK87_004589 [Glycine soja]